MSDWYTKGYFENLEQGDIIENCKVILPDEESYQALLSSENTFIETSYIEQTMIVMSQSCDLQNGKIDSVILCPVAPLHKIFESNEFIASKDGREQLRQGNQPAYHLLDEMTINSEEGFFCVSFHHIYSVPKSFLSKLIAGKERLRMNSPYKEHLSQSFARYFMRVGLPAGVSKDNLKSYAEKYKKKTT